MSCFPLFSRIAVVFACLALAAPAQDVRVEKAGADQVALDVSGFQASGEAGELFLRTLRSDLARSGWFRLAAGGGAELRVTGSAQEGRGGLKIECRLGRSDAPGSLLSQTWKMTPAQARKGAHTVADALVEAIGRKGFASARILLVGKRTGHKELYLCESDGGGMVQLTKDQSISLYPRWFPDGNRLAYAGFLKGFPDLYQIDLTTGKRQRISSYPGLNTGGAVSPDGQLMALVLSREGNPELYVRDLRTGVDRRLTRTLKAIESSPSWSPDGRRIAYVSDQSGSPQIWALPREGGSPRRLTTRGAENVAPSWGPNNVVAFASRSGRQYQVGLVHPDSGESRILALGGASFEDPCWTPNGRHLTCTRTVGRKSEISLVDTMTDEAVSLISASGDWYSASWTR
jgi:TolB protein